MTKPRLSYSLCKFIRKEKNRLKKETPDKEKLKESIKEIYKKLGL
ncbi:MAG: hypothetical protein WC499_01780 [Patescibacteria group bacterium]|jgi:hypothetical protein|nr:hypothetical protein [Patescibacteria group bacterium]